MISLSTFLYCAVSLSMTFYPMLSTGSTQKDRKLSGHDCKIVDWDVKHQQTQVKRNVMC